MPEGPAVGVLVPVKAFTQAKLRLAPVLDGRERATLARTMAATVLAAARDLPVWVVCDDDEVAAWARGAGAGVRWSPGRGLNGAVTDGVDALAAEGIQRVIVAHADLPWANDLTGLAAEAPGPRTVTLVPDEVGDGTNVISLPTDAGFGFRYGPGSFRRHCAEAERCGLEVHVVHDPLLAFDVDTPADLARLQPLPLQT